MKPYYQDSLVTLWHGDCRELLPEVAPVSSVSLVLTDPPYGMNHEPTRRSDGSKRWGDTRVAGDRTAFDPSHLLLYDRLVLWGAQWYANRLPSSGGWLVWDKSPHGSKKNFTASHADLAWTNLSGSISKFSLQWGGEARGGEGFFHPTQKPVALMAWIIDEHSQAGDVILDPYTGSGPVLCAAKDLQRKAIGIEIEERYCEIAAQRCSQETLELGA